MQLDTINTLYLELSQVATATTAKELALKKELAEIDGELWPDGDKPDNYAPDRALRVRAILSLAKKNAKALESAREALRAIVKQADCPRAHEIAYDELGMANTQISNSGA